MLEPGSSTPESPQSAYRILVDRETCIGVACCRAEAPHTFDLIHAKSHVINPTGDSLDDIMAAARHCPTESITVFDDQGHRLAP